MNYPSAETAGFTGEQKFDRSRAAGNCIPLEIKYDCISKIMSAVRSF